MKKFYEFVSERQDEFAQPGTAEPADQGFGNIGMGQNQLAPFMQSLRKMLGTRGVVNPKNRGQADMIRRVLRPPITQLMNNKDLGPNDIMLVIQQVVNIVMGQGSNPTLNSGRTRSQLQGSISQPGAASQQAAVNQQPEANV